MEKIKNTKRYDLEDRTLEYAKKVYRYIKGLSKDIGNHEIAKQLIRAAGSVGANYIEANEAISKKDFVLRIKICRKEAKESGYWLKLSEPSMSMIDDKNRLIQESLELTKIFGSILEKSRAD